MKILLYFYKICSNGKIQAKLSTMKIYCIFITETDFITETMFLYNK